MQTIRTGQPTCRTLIGFHLLTLILVVNAYCSPTSDRPPAPPSADVRAVAEDNNRFAFDLYARLRTGQSCNLFFSPASLSTALAMTYAGARGQTAEQMAQVLHFALPQEKLHPAFAELPRYWGVGGKGRGYRLSMANRLWGQAGFHFLPGFMDLTREHYGAELAQVDFARHAEKVRQRINAWVEEQTQDKIRDLIPPGVLGPKTRLVRSNAIYFKGGQGDGAVPSE